MTSSPAVDTIMKQAAKALAEPAKIGKDVPIKVGVDLGTAFTVIVVTDENGTPLAAANQFADVVRDGIVWDFAGAMAVVRNLKAKLEEITGRELTHGAVTIPPAVTDSDHRAHHYVVEGAGIECDAVVDEPTAANAILGLKDGAVVDIGGGTTGIAIIRDGKVLETLDEPTGGTHLSLVISGATRVTFAEAEETKRDPANHAKLMPFVRPTLEKISTIVRQGVACKGVERIHLVGGTSAFTGLDKVMTSITGIPCSVAPEPMLVTPLGVASWSKAVKDEPLW